uniref:Uncharacterized protein n=1 Tax=Varanus komodoensis TaxID=61221 RepID=A0A8D2L607_VARKO
MSVHSSWWDLNPLSLSWNTGTLLPLAHGDDGGCSLTHLEGSSSQSNVLRASNTPQRVTEKQHWLLLKSRDGRRRCCSQTQRKLFSNRSPPSKPRLQTGFPTCAFRFVSSKDSLVGLASSNWTFPT